MLVMTTNSFLVNNLDPSEMQGGAKLYFRQVHFSNVMVVMLLITSFQVRQQMPSELEEYRRRLIGYAEPSQHMTINLRLRQSWPAAMDLLVNECLDHHYSCASSFASEPIWL